jgi:hypothetical protein
MDGASRISVFTNRAARARRQRQPRAAMGGVRLKLSTRGDAK